MIRKVFFYLCCSSLLPLSAYIITLHNDTDYTIQCYIQAQELNICTGLASGTIASHTVGVIDTSKQFKRMGGYVSSARCCIQRITLKAQTSAAQKPADYVQGPLLCSDMEKHIVVSNNKLILQ